jgi:small-conductance mechanosensitive channel
MDWNALLERLQQPLFTIGQQPISLATLAQLVLVALGAWLAAHVATSVLRRRILARTSLDAGQQYAIARFAGYGIGLIGLLVGLSTVGIDLTSLTVLLGALGVGVGFGLQNVVNNFVSGLILLLERPFQLGHRVEVDGTVGRVEKIGARSTVIVTNDNIAMIVPNSKFIENPLINWSLGGDRRVRFDLPVGVSYGSKPREVERLLLEVARADPNVLQQPPPDVVFLGFGESSLDFQLRVWTSSQFERPKVFKSPLYFAIWEAFQRAGVEIPFPQRDLHVKGPVSVALERS